MQEERIMLKMYFARFVLKMFYIFRIDRNKIFFSSYEGAALSCNPKYIYLELRKRYGDKLTYVWELNDDNNRVDKETIKYVKHNSLPYIFHVMTSKVIISNTGITADFPIRKSQLSINTWHGAGCYKKVGINLAETDILTYKKRRKYSEKNITYYLSGCEAWTRVFSKAVLSDEKKFLPLGSPRNDFLIKGLEENRKIEILNKLGINTKFVLYAPTYRGDRDTPEEAECPLDVDKILLSLCNRFGGEWVFAYRCHYATASLFKGNDKTIDLSGYEDMQELLAIADVLISDYSSSVWDFSFTGKPCFLYCYDLEQYTDERDFYMPIREWHFPVSTNMEELIDQIQEFVNDEFLKSMELHHSDLGSYENGKATNSVVELITNRIKV